VVGLRQRCFFRSQLLARAATTAELGSRFYGRESEGNNLGSRLAHDLSLYGEAAGASMVNPKDGQSGPCALAHRRPEKKPFCRETENTNVTSKIEENMFKKIDS
jgi:hypothetical protein